MFLCIFFIIINIYLLFLISNHLKKKKVERNTICQKDGKKEDKREKTIFKKLNMWCGLFGRKEIVGLLRILRNPWFNYKLYAKRLYLIGLDVGASRIVPLSWSLFLLLVLHFKFFLVVWCCLFVCCIYLCSPSWTPCICFLLFYNLFNNTLITYQKKKKIYMFLVLGLKIISSSLMNMHGSKINLCNLWIRHYALFMDTIIRYDSCVTRTCIVWYIRIPSIYIDAGDARRFLFSIIYVCKSSVFFYVLGLSSLLGY